jgi:hypothetical protein|nr:MAG TPA: hypothetical protein [Caudoviricetes sp.]
MKNIFKTEEKMAMTFIKRILREDRVLLERVMALSERKAFIRNVRALIACVYASDSSVRDVKEFFERALYCFEKARMGC